MPFSFFKKKSENQPQEQEPVIIPTAKYLRRYSYEWKKDVPENERDTIEHPSRPFCKKMIELKRFYTRQDIQNISQFLGYDVMKRVGGDGCRHEWVSNIVEKKD